MGVELKKSIAKHRSTACTTAPTCKIEKT